MLLAATRDHEENGDFTSKAEVLGSLSDVEFQNRFTLPRLVRREADEAVFDAMPVESAAKRRLAVSDQREPSPFVRSPVFGEKLRARDLQRVRDACFVNDFDQGDFFLV